MHVVVFEGSRWDALAPFSLYRPQFLLRSGMTSLLEKQVRAMRPTRLSLWVRPEMESVCRTHVIPNLNLPTSINQPLDDEPALLCNARTLHLDQHPEPKDEGIAIGFDQFIQKAFVKRPGLSPQDVMNRTRAWTDLLELPRSLEESRFVEHVWDLIGWNEESLVADAFALSDAPAPHRAGPYHMVQDADIRVARTAVLGPGCVLDASRGPIVIDEHAEIGANAVLLGPCWVGAWSRLSPLSLVRPGTSIGRFCKAAGELSNCILHANVTKAHEGYIGDTYIGEWTNLGAGTTTSNTKITYGPVAVRMGEKRLELGRHKLGAIIGDHTKTAINTRLSTGTYVGFSCALAGEGLTPHFVPSFSFWRGHSMESMPLSKSIEIARRTLASQDKPFEPDLQRIFEYAVETAPRVER